MSTYLMNIVEHKRRELSKSSGNDLPTDVKRLVVKETFAERIRSQSTLGVIAEFKRSSPSKGIIHSLANPIEVADDYVKGGADGMSVLTDKEYFNGSFEDLQAVSSYISLPVLCKDFILEESQINKAFVSGASIVLLIVRILSLKKLKTLYEYAVHLKMEVLFEVHDEDDLEVALSLKPELIGINNRNLQTFNTDLAVTEKLIELIHDPSIIVISESGIKNVDDCLRVANAGVDAILVGEALMKHQDPAQFVKEIKQIERRSNR